VAGFLYIIDFDRMIQLRRNDPSRRRRIKRDLSSIPKKGVAGIKLPSQLEAELTALHSATSDDTELNVTAVDVRSATNNNDLCPPTPTAPSNTPQTPHTPSAASSSSGSPDTTEHLHSLSSDSHHHHYHYLPHHHHHLHYHQLHIPHHLVHNLNSANDHNNILSQSLSLHVHQPHNNLHTASSVNAETQPQESRTIVATAIDSQNSDVVEPSTNVSSGQVLELEAAVYQMDQLSLSNDAPEFYPLDLTEETEDSAEETEQYHLTLSSEDEQL